MTNKKSKASLQSPKIKWHSLLPAIVGAVLWVATAQFYITQFVVAAAWQNPPYIITNNFISNLGSQVCDELVCSPLKNLMNASFITLGFSITLGALIFAYYYRKNLSALIGFLCLALSGVGTLFVGLFPIGTNDFAHGTGAYIAFLLGNTGLVILAIGLTKHPLWLRLLAGVLGAIALGLLWFYMNQLYLGLGVGIMQRIIAYPQTIFMISFGVYTLAITKLQEK